MRHLLRHPGQTALSVLGVALGVAVVVSIELAVQSAREAFRVSTETVAGRASHRIVGGPTGVPDSVFTLVHGVAPAFAGLFALLLGLVAAAAAVAAVGGWWAARRGGDEGPAAPTLSLRATLGGADTAGYARATEPRAFRFPEDHGAHPEFRTEWWYVTGNLEGPEGRRFGYQLTLFRSALAPEAPDSPSRWATNQAWMGHLTVTDPEAGRFHAFERFERGAVGLAGAEVEDGGEGAGGRVRVWIGDWILAGSPPNPRSVGPPGDAMAESAPVGPPSIAFRVTAASPGDSVALDLRLVPLKPVVLQGERGLSRKGPEPGNASHYYSFPRLATEGTVVTPSGRFPVTGTSWLDREWGTSALSAGVVGWDWFALQLDDGRELMVYLLREADGTPGAFSEGVLVGPEGGVTRLPADAFQVEATGRWRSPRDGSTYPSGWQLSIPGQRPGEALDLRIEPVLEDQELDLAFRYWEGAVDVRGTSGGRPVTGRGYVELTGYADGAAPRGAPPGGRDR